jgi:hypothetical protein
VARWFAVRASIPLNPTSSTLAADLVRVRAPLIVGPVPDNIRTYSRLPGRSADPAKVVLVGSGRSFRVTAAINRALETAAPQVSDKREQKRKIKPISRIGLSSGVETASTTS